MRSIFCKELLKLFKQIFLFFLLIVGSLQTKSQAWGIFWSENFNGQTYESCYPSGGGAYWGDCDAVNPRNSLINGAWEVTNTNLGYTQTPSDESGGRFLMYWTNINNTTDNNTFFRKTFTNAVVGQQYRISFKVGELNSTSPSADISLNLTMNAVTTTIYSETNTFFPTTSWTTVSYAGSGDEGATTMLFTATSTSFTLDWINIQNTGTGGTGNDFGIDDLLVETTVYTISGSVLNDNNAMTGGVNGSGVQNTNVSLYTSDGVTQLATTTTDANGIYSFPNFLPGSYQVAVTPPAGYSHVSSTDATPLNGVTDVSITNANISNVNFGINQPPIANAVSQTITSPGTNQIAQGTITQAVSGNDPGVGSLTNGNTVVVTALPTNGTLYYNGVPVVAGTSIPSFSTSLLSITNLQGGTTSTQFNYTFIDAAGLQGSSETFTVQWTTALPAKLGAISLKQLDENRVLIDWKTDQEFNNKGFFIEHSTDGRNWISVGFEASKAKQGTSTLTLKYNFIHTNPQNGYNYYRLKQVDFDGKYEYTTSQTIKVKFTQNEVAIYPNPSSEKVYFQFSDLSQIGSIQLIDLSGKSLKSFNRYVTDININNLPQGIYFIKVLFNNQRKQVFKIFKR